MPGWPGDSGAQPSSPPNPATTFIGVTDIRDLSLAEIVNGLPSTHAARNQWAKMVVDAELAASVCRMVRSHNQSRAHLEGIGASTGRGIGLTEDSPLRMRLDEQVQTKPSMPTREQFRRAIGQVNQAFSSIDPADRAALMYELIVHLSGGGVPTR
jgi:hypothetical protein